MLNIAVVGCTGKLGSVICKDILIRNKVTLRYAIARRGNPNVGKCLSNIVGENNYLRIIDDIELAEDCDIFIDCTNAETFMNTSYNKYEKMKKPLIIATTAFTNKDILQINKLAMIIPILMTGNFSIGLHNFIESVKFAVKRISEDTDIQIIEYHHNQKKDAPSGTSLMIKMALLNSNSQLKPEKIGISSIRGGNIFGEHEVIFANCNDEVITFRHQVSSRKAFADGAIEASIWTYKQSNGLYDMDDFCNKMVE